MSFMIEPIQINLFLITYLLIENYIMYHQRFSTSMDKEAIEYIPLWGMPKEVISEDELKEQNEIAAVYSPSIIEEEHEAYFQNFTKDLLEEDCINVEPPHSYFEHEYIHTEQTWENLVEPVRNLDQQAGPNEHSDTLTMDDWNEDLSTNVSNQLSTKANAKIEDCLLGEQQWVVELIGQEQDFIHVSDGTARAWIDAKNHIDLNRGDILSILVDRISFIEIEAKAIDILQSRSMEFMILDEPNYQDYQIDITISA
ncbi:hypothetical protein [Bacillus cihuensis]|uniref:hypothetical protein n=1 Tax=Bacillus cihuensis TaxID=1208599 RepID=UPI000407725E|nr:hypothetical protein [Bacillus cihuensis]